MPRSHDATKLSPRNQPCQEQQNVRPARRRAPSSCRVADQPVRAVSSVINADTGRRRAGVLTAPESLQAARPARRPRRLGTSGDCSACSSSFARSRFRNADNKIFQSRQPSAIHKLSHSRRTTDDRSRSSERLSSAKFVAAIDYQSSLFIAAPVGSLRFSSPGISTCRCVAGRRVRASGLRFTGTRASQPAQRYEAVRCRSGSVECRRWRIDASSWRLRQP